MIELQIEYPTFTKWIEAGSVNLDLLANYKILSYRQVGRSSILRDEHEENIIKIIEAIKKG
jgi:hypothetical protein